jgi:hypothetical protein
VQHCEELAHACHSAVQLGPPDEPLQQSAQSLVA